MFLISECYFEIIHHNPNHASTWTFKHKCIFSPFHRTAQRLPAKAYRADGSVDCNVAYALFLCNVRFGLIFTASLSRPFCDEHVTLWSWRRKLRLEKEAQIDEEGKEEWNDDSVEQQGAHLVVKRSPSLPQMRVREGMEDEEMEESVSEPHSMRTFGDGM